MADMAVPETITDLARLGLGALGPVASPPAAAVFGRGKGLHIASFRGISIAALAQLMKREITRNPPWPDPSSPQTRPGRREQRQATAQTQRTSSL